MRNSARSATKRPPVMTSIWHWRSIGTRPSAFHPLTLGGFTFSARAVAVMLPKCSITCSGVMPQL